MAHHFKIDDLLDDLEHATFARLSRDRQTTIDALHHWLLNRGHLIGRTAVANYIRALRDRQAMIIAPAADLRDDVAAMRFLKRWAMLLHGEELRQLAIYAAWLLNTVASRDGIEIEAVNGFARLSVRPATKKRRRKRRVQRVFNAALKR